VIIPSIDLMDGHAVQLVGGELQALDAGDPIPLVERFRLAGEIAVVDLDAALGRGSNDALIERLCRSAPCRVGGGIRDLETATSWLDRGAERIVLGTAAQPDLLAKLPPERVVVALDARDGEVVVDGWRRRTGRGIAECMRELSGLAGGFLVTFVEREGRLGGTALERVEELVTIAGDARLTVAGGVTTPGEIAALDRLGADAQVGMALYTGRLPLAGAIAAPLRCDRSDELWPTVVVDEGARALGLAYSDRESLRAAVQERRGVYHSRRRGLWRKGETSGDVQELLRIDLDCDRDALRFTVRQRGGGFCHRGSRSCWGEDRGLARLERRLRERVASAPAGSYVAALLRDPGLLAGKLREEADELAMARDRQEVIWEAADLLFFALVSMARASVTLEDVECELDARALRLTRRAGSPQGALR